MNDDTFDPHGGFDTHPHKNMEIISYVIDGVLTHKDSMQNERTLTKGQVQYMSAGTGVLHSEFNHGDTPLRFLQIWIYPDKEGYLPNYGDVQFTWESRINTWLPIVSPSKEQAPIQIHQDMHISVVYLEKGKQIEYPIGASRQVYLIQIEGEGTINEIALFEKDGVEIRNERTISLHAITDSHYIAFDMKEEVQF